MRATTRTRMRSTAIVMMLTIAASTTAALQDSSSENDEQHAASIRTERVVIFKDGYGLLIKSITGTTDARGRLVCDEVPDSAVLGSFWATAADDHELLAIATRWRTATETHSSQRHCESMLDLLRANLNQPLTIRTHDDEELNAIVTTLLGDGPAVDDDNGIGARTDSSSSSSAASVHPATVSSHHAHREPPIALLKLGDGRMRTLPLSMIRSITSETLETTYEHAARSTSRQKVLEFDFGPEVTQQPVTLTLMYLSPNLRWIPSYRLTGELESHASISMQGLILNELEDFEDVAVDLVAGVPSFRFATVASPLALQPTITNVLRQTSPQLAQQMSNALFTQRAGEFRSMNQPSDREAAADAPPSFGQDRAEDLFVFPIQRLTLKKSERAAVSLWRHTVPVEHLYTFDIHQVRDAQSGYTSYSSRQAQHQMPDNSPLQLHTQSVWHQLRLKNTTNTPWSTGPALLVSGTLPLGQDLLTYTPVGGESLLPVTVAVNVRGDHREVELDRELDALHWNSRTYTRVSKRGTVTLRNFNEQPLNVRVEVACGGEITSASDDGSITIDDYHPADWDGSSHAINNHSTATWNIMLQPGETRDITYTVQFYVR